jgi:exopolysaccharide biosynthesis WecB/TagA/CpsF family protein
MSEGADASRREGSLVPSSPLGHVSVLGVPIARMTREDALAAARQLHDADGTSVISFVHAHSLNVSHTDARHRAALMASDVVLNDGVGLAFAARLQRASFPANLNGTDFTPALLDLAAELGWTVFLLGGRPGTAEAARDALQANHPDLKVVGVHHGFFENDGEVAAHIAATRPDLLLAGLGSPRQEVFLHEQRHALGCRLAAGVGAFFEFAAGQAPRAPWLLRKARLEWLWRMSHEPARLWRRYLLGTPQFMWRCATARLFRGR